MGTLVVSIILVGIVSAIIGTMIKNKKKGKTCSSCGSCPSSSVCHMK